MQIGWSDAKFSNCIQILDLEKRLQVLAMIPGIQHIEILKFKEKWRNSRLESLFFIATLVRIAYPNRNF